MSCLLHGTSLHMYFNWLEILTAWQSSKTSSDSDPNLIKNLQARQRTVSIMSEVVVKINLLSIWSKACRMMSLYKSKSLMSLCNQQFDCLLDFSVLCECEWIIFFCCCWTSFFPSFKLIYEISLYFLTKPFLLPISLPARLSLCLLAKEAFAKAVISFMWLKEQQRTGQLKTWF